MGARVILGNCLEVMARMEAASVDAVVCDPPYNLSDSGKRDDVKTSSRAVGGFMGLAWDGWESPAAFQRWCLAWGTEALRVLKPGGYLIAFGGSRTYHRLATGLEDAGFVIADQIMWCYGSGFPKGRNVSKVLDVAAGAAREVVGYKTGADPSVTRPGFCGGAHSKVANQTKEYPVTVAATAEAKLWDGWNTALKPAHEPAVLALKPREGTIAANVLVHGAGALNVAACHVSGDGAATTALDEGRWPANLVLGHQAECRGSTYLHTGTLCAPGCPVAELEVLAPGAPRFFYIAKPRKREKIGGVVRNLHPTVKALDLMRWLVRLVTPVGGTVLDPFLGSGTTGCAAMVEGFSFVGIEREASSHETALARISDYAFAYGRERPTT